MNPIVPLPAPVVLTTVIGLPLLPVLVHGASQLDSPVELVEVGSTSEYREVVHAQQAQDQQLLLTPDSCFFFPTGPRLTGQQASSIPGAEFNGGNTFDTITDITEPGQLIQWPLLPMNDGTVDIDVFLDTPASGVELVVRLGTVEHAVTTSVSDGTSPQPWGLTAALTGTGASVASIRYLELELVDLHGAPELGDIVQVRLSGPSMTDDYLLRARWRPAAIHGGFQSASLAATGLGSDLYVMEQVADYSSPTSLSFYAPVTTHFGYYGSVFDKVPGDPDGKFTATSPNFSMWNYGAGGSPPPLPEFCHLLGVGDAGMIFDGFHHEGTGVKPRLGSAGAWPLDGTPLESFVTAFSQDDPVAGDVHPYTHYFGHYWHPGEDAWRFYASGRERTTAAFSLPSSFVEVPGPPSRQRTGQVVRRMLYRGWIRDTAGSWHPIDSQPVGAGPGDIVNKVWDKTGDGWLVKAMGGIVHREYLQSGGTVTITPTAGLPDYMDPAKLAAIDTPAFTITLDRVVARSDDTLDLSFSLAGNPDPAEVLLFHGDHDGLTLIFEDDDQPDEWDGPLSLGTFAAGSHTVSVPADALSGEGFCRLLAEPGTPGRYWSHRSGQWTLPVESPILPSTSGAGAPVAVVSFANPTPGQDVSYSIAAGNDDGLFAIDPADGTITLARDATLSDAGDHELDVVADLDGWSTRVAAIGVEVSVQAITGPYLQLSTDSFDLGHHRSLAEPFLRRLTLTNAGDGYLFLQQADFAGDAVFSLSGPLPEPIAPGESADLGIVFDPPADGGFSGTLTLTTNDTNQPAAVVSLSGALDTAGFRIADFDFDPDQLAGTVADLDGSPGSAWLTGALIDQATGTGALGGSNQSGSNRGLVSGSDANYLRLSSNRESDGQTPLAAGGNDESTWLTTTVSAANPAAIFDFDGATASLDSYAASGLTGTTSADWTLYHSTNGGASWTSLGTQAGASIGGAGSAGPVPLVWDLSPIGSVAGEVRFLLDPVSTGSTNGTAAQRSIGFDNFVIGVSSIAPPADPPPPPPGTATLAVFDFSPDHTAAGIADLTDLPTTGWTVTDLIDHAVGTGALGAGNQDPINRAHVGAHVPHLRIASARESDAQTPNADGGDQASTWFTFDLGPDAGTVLDFTAGTLDLDTFAHSTLSGTTSANWTLYFRRQGESAWTSLGQQQGASISGAGNTGPVTLGWSLAPISRSAGTIELLIDPESAGFGTNGAASQRGIGLGNIVLSGVSEAGRSFADWCESHGIAGALETDDHDHDGLNALLEYGLGLDPEHADPSPATLDKFGVTFPKGPDAVAAGALLWIETSTDLGNVDPWTPVAPDFDDPHRIGYTLPAGDPRHFVRFGVVQP